MPQCADYSATSRRPGADQPTLNAAPGHTCSPWARRLARRLLTNTTWKTPCVLPCPMLGSEGDCMKLEIFLTTLDRRATTEMPTFFLRLRRAQIAKKCTCNSDPPKLSKKLCEFLAQGNLAPWATPRVCDVKFRFHFTYVNLHIFTCFYILHVHVKM